jgi:hypothetical protein
MLGSVLLVSSPVHLMLAFTVEPERGFQAEMWWSAAGLYSLFAGCMGHLASGIGKLHQEPVIASEAMPKT